MVLNMPMIRKKGDLVFEDSYGGRRLGAAVFRRRRQETAFLNAADLKTREPLTVSTRDGCRWELKEFLPSRIGTYFIFFRVMVEAGLKNQHAAPICSQKK